MEYATPTTMNELVLAMHSYMRVIAKKLIVSNHDHGLGGYSDEDHMALAATVVAAFHVRMLNCIPNIPQAFNLFRNLMASDAKVILAEKLVEVVNEKGYRAT